MELARWVCEILCVLIDRIIFCILEGITLRIHAGLEDVNDLIKDLKQGLERLEKSNQT
jgi:hypothetical protein